MEIQIVGKVIEVREKKQTARGPIQEILLRRPKFAKGKTINDNYPIIFFGEMIEQYNPDALHGKWIRIDVYINGKSYPDENGSSIEKVVLSAKYLKELSK